MTKEEARLSVMGAISIALKDSTLQQGFEIICKKNAELEKENKELKTVKIPQLGRKIASIRGAHSVDCKKLYARTEQVERLKKENAELKEKENTVHTLDVFHKEAVRKYGEANAQLTKAKKLLNDFMRISKASDEDFEHDYSELIREAEQFLNSEASE